ncbi:MAG: metal-dependent hydrolase [Candidatus Pacearchaeota archaeon]|nr:metal-dependent hydrolase [Candidatus Pacearchaeota archaeon]
MMFRTHIIFALFFYLLFIKIFSLQFSWVFAAIMAFGSILPDIDSPSSFVNRKYLFGIGKGIAAFSEHRGFFHSVFGILIFTALSLVVTYFTRISLIHVLAIPLGYFMHLAADSLNVSGIKWLWRSNKLHIKGPIKTGGFIEQLFFIALLFLTIYIILGNQGLQSITAFVSKIKP